MLAKSCVSSCLPDKGSITPTGMAHISLRRLKKKKKKEDGPHGCLLVHRHLRSDKPSPILTSLRMPFTPFQSPSFHCSLPLVSSHVRHKCPFRQIPLSCTAQPQKSTTSRKRPYGYWKHRENILAELKEYIKQHKNEPVMPTQSELLATGRSDLAGAIHRYGPWKKMADEAGLVLSSIAKPRSLNLVYCTTLRSERLRPYMYWRDFENLRAELKTFLSDFCEGRDEKCEYVLPSAAELEAAGRSDLVRAIGKHGGWESVAERLDLHTAHRSSEYWSRFENVEEAVRRILEERADEVADGTMPSSVFLRKYGAPGLYSAIVRLYGGAASVARRLGLTMTLERKPRGFWEDHENLYAEVLCCLRDICEAHPERDESLMPLFAEFLKIGRADVYAAIARAGGIARVAAQLGLKYSSVREKSSLPRQSKTESD